MDQHEVLNQLGKIGAARRGQISEQWYESAGRDGKPNRTGPYYVWQRFLDGEKVSARIPREEAPRALAELARGREAEALISRFWQNAEALAESEKKTAGRKRFARSDRNSDKLRH